MTADDQPPNGFDMNASPRLVADLPQTGVSYDWTHVEVWRQTFATATWVEARPGGPLLDPLGPSEIDEVVIARLERGNNGKAIAILRAGHRWIGIESEHSDTLGFTHFSSGRAHVADRLADVVRFGLGEWDCVYLELPTELDAAIRWAEGVEEGCFTSWTRVLDQLGGNRARWSAGLNALLESGVRWNGEVGFHPTEIAEVVASVERLDSQPAGYGSATVDAALVRLHDGMYASFAVVHHGAGSAQLLEPVIHQDHEVVLTRGFAAEHRDVVADYVKQVGWYPQEAATEHVAPSDAPAPTGLVSGQGDSSSLGFRWVDGQPIANLVEARWRMQYLLNHFVGTDDYAEYVLRNSKQYLASHHQGGFDFGELYGSEGKMVVALSGGKADLAFSYAGPTLPWVDDARPYLSGSESMWGEEFIGLLAEWRDFLAAGPSAAEHRAEIGFDAALNYWVLDGAVASLGLDGHAPWLTVLRNPGDGTALIDRSVLVDGHVVAHDDLRDRWYVLDAATGHMVHSDVALSDLPACTAEAIRSTSAHDVLPGAFVSDWKFPVLGESEPLDPRRVQSIPDEILTSQGAHLLARWAVGELAEDELLETATELVASGCPDPLVLQIASLWHTPHTQSDEFSAWIRELGRRCDLTDPAGLGVLVAWLFLQSLRARTELGLPERNARLLTFQHLFRHLRDGAWAPTLAFRSE